MDKAVKSYRIPILIVSVFLIICSCSNNKTTAKYWNTSGEIQGTFYNITYESAENLDSVIYRELKRFDKSMSIFDSTSTISRVNRNDSTLGVVKDTVFLRVFNRSQEISELTDGIFDITVSPLVKLWGFNHAKQVNVSANMIDSIKQFVGYKKIRLQDGKITKSDNRVEIDANAIAQGYSSDLIAELLERHGVNNYMVEIGGEIHVKGYNAKNNDWSIGISKPIFDSTCMNNELQTVIHLNKGSVATSGNYHKFHIVNGEKIGHEISPITGYPTANSLLSATVVTESCIDADAYATAFMVMGLDKSLELCKKTKKIEAYFIYLDNNNIKDTYTPGFKQYIKE